MSDARHALMARLLVKSSSAGDAVPAISFKMMIFCGRRYCLRTMGYGTADHVRLEKGS